MALSRYVILVAILVATLVATLAVMPALAFADGWEVGFEPETLPDNLRNARVVIFPVGPEAEQAAVVFEASLKTIGSTVVPQHVMRKGLLLADEEILERLAHLPVQVVIVIRQIAPDPTLVMEPEVVAEAEAEAVVEAEAVAEPESLVTPEVIVSYYSLDGNALGAYLVKQGQPITRQQTINIGRGISQATMDATAAAMSPDDPVASKPKPRRGAKVQVHGSEGTLSLHFPEENQTLTGVEIYEFLERDDLVRAYQAEESVRDWTRDALFGAASLGAAVTFYGVVSHILISNREYPANSAALSECQSYENPRVAQNCRVLTREQIIAPELSQARWIIGIGAGVTLSGVLGAYLINRNWSVHPISGIELHRLVRALENEKDALEPQDLSSNFSWDSEFFYEPVEKHAGVKLRMQW